MVAQILFGLGVAIGIGGHVAADAKVVGGPDAEIGRRATSLPRASSVSVPMPVMAPGATTIAASIPHAMRAAAPKTDRTGVRIAALETVTGIADWQPLITEASVRFGVPVAWIDRVMALESGGRTRQGHLPIRSKAGAMGLMQLMPATWIQMRDALGLGVDPDDPRDNIMAGTAYLRLMYDRFGYPGLFAAYNAGPARYAASLASGRPLPAETRTYLALAIRMTGAPVAAMPGSVRTVPNASPYRAQYPAQIANRRSFGAGLFFATSHSAAQPQATPASAQTSQLFVMQGAAD